MISIHNSPNDISFSRNPILFQAKVVDGSGDPYRAVGVQSILTSTGEWGIVEDELVRIEWTDEEGASYSVGFRAKNTPLDDEFSNQIPADPSGYGSLLAYYQAVAEKIGSFYLVAPTLTISAAYDGAEYTLTAEHKTISDNVTVNWNTDDITTSPNFTKTNNTTSTPLGLPDNHKVLCQVIFEDERYSLDWEKIVELDTIIDADGIASFQVQHILDKEIENALPSPSIPTFNDATAQIADNVRRYFLRYREDYDGISPIEWFQLGPYSAMNGGIAQNLFAQYNIFDNLDAGNSILSYQPDGKHVSTDQPEWLPWYNVNDADVNVFIRVRFYDDTNAAPQHTENYSAAAIAAKIYETVLFPVGLAQMDTSSVGFDIWKYDVQVLDFDEYDAGNPDVFYSQVRTYYVDHAEYREKRYLMYLNGFGVPQTVRCIGDYSDDLEVSREESRKILTPDYAGKETLTIQYTETFEKFFTYRTGYMRRLEIDALQEALIYNNLYEVYEEGFIPLYLVEDRFRIHSTRDFLHSLEIRCKPAIELGNYSNVLIPVAAEQDGWTLNPTDYWRTVFGQPWTLS